MLTAARTLTFTILLCTAGEDYQPTNKTVIFDRNDIENFLIVNIENDDITERTESFGIRLILPEATQQLGVTLGDDSEVIIGIRDDDGNSFTLMQMSLFNTVTFIEGDLEITCFTVYSSENRTVTLFFEGNQEADFSCALNDGDLEICK